MSKILQNIISLFSSVQIKEQDIVENYSEVIVSVVCTDGKCPTIGEFNVALIDLNSRDNLHISILQNSEVVENYDSTNSDFVTYVNICSNCLNRGDFELRITIVKKNNTQIISIYYLNRFIKYLLEQPTIYFLDKISEIFNSNNFVVFEVQDNFENEFSTKTIKFIPKGNQVTSSNSINRTEKINKTKTICHCNIISKYEFTPDDFYPTNKSGTALDNVFGRYSLLYSAIFLFDIFSIDNSNIEYKLNGYKTISQKLNLQSIDVSSYGIYYKIYEWIYNGDNVVDKIGLARNILSLNLEKENLKVSETTFEAIRNGYDVYLKENIKQYIEIRNKVSDQLIELQNKADKIAESFVNDYKKSFFAVVSFFISVIVIRVISKGDSTGIFNAEVTFLTIVFLLISLSVMFLARWEISKQIKRYKEFYNNFKIRYTDLLDESDIKRILNNDKDFEDNIKFVKERKRNYTIIWATSIISIILICIILFMANDSSFCHLIKEGLCFIKSMLQ
jgi:hypothetical protein